MADQNESGELLLTSLSTFFERKENEIIKGRVTVRLHPRALEYLASRLQSLRDLDHLRESSPVEFFRGAFADVDDYNQLQKLQQFVASIRCLCISSTVHRLRDPTRVNLLPFKSLTHLELRSCDLSTSAWLGFPNVSRKLQSLTCIGCLEELRHLLAPFSSAFSVSGSSETSKSRTSSSWPSLTQLICKQNSLSEIDETVTLQNLRKMDLSSNNINRIQNLQECTALEELNLSHNSIESLRPLRDGPLSLKCLVLQGNAIRSVRGLSELTALTELDLQCNLFASYQEFDQLQDLSSLKLLWLEGNPLAYAPFYRLDVLSWFPGPLLRLDGIATRKEEREAVQMRAVGQIPLAWRIMAQYVGQREFLWKPPKQVASQEQPPTWGARSLRSPSRRHMASPSHHSPSLRRSVPSRRIVEFSGDPLAALDESLLRPPSPSPFHPIKDDLLETASQSSTSSALPPRTWNGWDKNVQAVYRERSESSLHAGLPSAASSKIIARQPTKLVSHVLQDLSVSSETPQLQDEHPASPASDTSSSLASTSASSLHASLDHAKRESAELAEILQASKMIS